MSQQDGGSSEIIPIAAVRSADDLRVLFRKRIASLGITYETADTIAGLPAGYTAKLLGPTPRRRFGPVSLEALLGATGIKLLAVEDAEALARSQRALCSAPEAVSPARRTKEFCQDHR